MHLLLTMIQIAVCLTEDEQQQYCTYTWLLMIISCMQTIIKRPQNSYWSAFSATIAYSPPIHSRTSFQSGLGNWRHCFSNMGRDAAAVYLQTPPNSTMLAKLEQPAVHHPLLPCSIFRYDTCNGSSSMQTRGHSKQIMPVLDCCSVPPSPGALVNLPLQLIPGPNHSS